jgi:hypothetical protein
MAGKSGRVASVMSGVVHRSDVAEARAKHKN